MKNLDDGPDGLNDDAFDRMLGNTPAKRKPTQARLEKIAAWVRTHGLSDPVEVAYGAVRFVCADGTHHAVTTMDAAREALGY